MVLVRPRRKSELMVHTNVACNHNTVESPLDFFAG
jgi:hypothetical protein